MRHAINILFSQVIVLFFSSNVFLVLIKYSMIIIYHLQNKLFIFEMQLKFKQKPCRFVNNSIKYQQNEQSPLNSNSLNIKNNQYIWH